MTYKTKNTAPYHNLLNQALLAEKGNPELSKVLALILFEAVSFSEDDDNSSLSSCIYASATIAREAEYELKTAGFYADIQTYPEDQKEPDTEKLRSIYLELINPKENND